MDAVEDQPIVLRTVWSGRSNNNFFFYLLFRAATGNAVATQVSSFPPHIIYFETIQF